MPIVLNGSTSGSITIDAPAVAGTPTLTLPTTSGTVATLTTPSFATTIGVGGATAAASGAGITFPATASASSDANTLDDYEEGTWTPVIASQTGSLTSYTSSGTYTKIGRTVYIIAKFEVVTSGTASGYANVSGYPFTSASSFDTNGTAREGASSGDIFDALLVGGSTAGFVLGLSGNGPLNWTAGRTYYWNIFYNV